MAQAADWDLPLPALADRLRRQMNAIQAHLVMEQLELRRQARHRFPAADRMFFTRQGLQQATDATIAAYKAARFPKDRPRYDLCCGIGGDLLALAEHGETTGIDRDPLTAYLAQANGRQLARRRCEVRPLDVSLVQPDPEVAVHLDPDRRPHGRRSVRLDHHEPPRGVLERLIAGQRYAALKLAPATPADDPLLRPAQLEWIGHRRECQQLVAWFGDAALYPGRRVATVLDAPAAMRSLIGEACGPLAMTCRVDQFVLEPHAAVLAAGLSAQLAHQLDYRSLTAGGGYLTGGRSARHPLATTFEVLAVSSCRVKRLRAVLRRHEIGRLEVKTRGVAVDPGRLQAALSTSGDRSAVLLITRLQGSCVAILGRRVATPADGPSAGDLGSG